MALINDDNVEPEHVMAAINTAADAAPEPDIAAPSAAVGATSKQTLHGWLEGAEVGADPDECCSWACSRGCNIQHRNGHWCDTTDEKGNDTQTYAKKLVKKRKRKKVAKKHDVTCDESEFGCICLFEDTVKEKKKEEEEEEEEGEGEGEKCSRYVECPVCYDRVIATWLNHHLDQNCE